MLAGVIVSGLAYAVGLVKLGASSPAARQRVAYRALSFLLVNLFTVGPIAGMELASNNMFDKFEIFGEIAWALFLLDGFFNVCNYVILNRRTRHMAVP